MVCFLAYGASSSSAPVAVVSVLVLDVVCSVREPESHGVRVVQPAEHLLLHAGEHDAQDGEEDRGDDEAGSDPADFAEAGELERCGRDLGDDGCLVESQ